MLKDVILELFGSYVPISYTTDSSVLVIPNGNAGVDWVWISGVVLFAITFVCVFRLIGVIIKKHD